MYATQFYCIFYLMTTQTIKGFMYLDLKEKPYLVKIDYQNLTLMKNKLSQGMETLLDFLRCGCSGYRKYSIVPIKRTVLLSVFY